MKPYDWNKEKLEQLRHLNSQGMSDKEIGKKFGLSEYTIRDRRLRLGIRNGPRPADCDELWNKENEAQFKELFFNGIPVKQIAKRLQITPWSIDIKTKKMGWKRPHPGRGGKRKVKPRNYITKKTAPHSHFDVVPTKNEMEMFDRINGRVKTIKDFSKKEIQEMEKLYGAK